VPCPRELPDALIVGLELLEARQDGGDGGTGMCACLVPEKPRNPTARGFARYAFMAVLSAV